MSKNIYDPKFKFKVVVESLNGNTTLETVRKKHNLSHNAMNNWRKLFFGNGQAIFETKTKSANTEDSTDDLKKIIADLTIENAILKKVSNYMT